MAVPLCDLNAQYQELKSELDHALISAAQAGNFILGPNVKAFEKEMATFLGCKYAVGVGNGTDALHLALRALNVGPGDEVITTPFTFIATTEAIQIVGAKPVFVDITLETYNIDPQQIERAITPRTKAIIPVHLYGQPCQMDAILSLAKQYNLRIIEDCAQSLGAKFDGRHTGTFGDAGCLSFFPSKNLGCMGDGGMIVTNNAEVYERAEMLRRHGGKVKYYHSELGVNSRLDDLQAAVLRVKLPHIARWNAQRHAVAERYQELLPKVVIKQFPPLSQGVFESVFHQYTLLTENRDELSKKLTDRGVGNAIYYPVPLHLQQVNAYLGHSQGDFPNAEYAALHCLSLPMSPHVSEAHLLEVAAAIREHTSALRAA